MEIGSRKTSPTEIEPLQIVKHEFNQLVNDRQCDKSFNFRDDLVKHQRMHNGKKPYQCNQCVTNILMRKDIYYATK